MNPSAYGRNGLDDRPYKFVSVFRFFLSSEFVVGKYPSARPFLFFFSQHTVCLVS